jgi:hypothetical protein
MPCALDDDQGVRSGDHAQGVLHLRDRSERVFGPVDEKRPRAKLGKVGCPQLRGLPRRVQR